MNRRSALAFVLTAVLLFSFAPSASALYQWVDEQGNLHITDNPPPSRQQREEPEAPRTPAAPSPAPVPETVPVLPSTVPQAAKPAAAQSQPLLPAATTPALRPAAGVPQTSPSPSAPQAVSAPVSAAQPAPTAVKEGLRAKVPSLFLPGSAPAGNYLPSLFAGFLTVFLFIAIGAYVFFSLCLYLIAKKLNVAEAWAAWIPIIQIWPLLTSAGKPCWWVLLLCIPFVNAIVSVYLWMCIAENLGRNKWLGLLMLLPIINFVFMGVLAFAGDETAEPARAA